MLRSRGIRIFFVILISLFLCSCGSTNKNEEASRKIVEKYFDALKYGDHEDEMECYTPIVRKQEDAKFGLLGQASKLFLKLDLGEVLRNINILYGGNSYEELDFNVEQVVLDEEEKKAAVYVKTSKDGEFIENLRIDTVKYDGEWYIEYNSIAPDDRDPNELVAEDASKEKTPWWKNRIFWIFVGSIIAVILSVLLIIIIKNNRGSKTKNSYDLPPVYTPLVGDTSSGEILCSCGMINPVGVRTCMGCGKKLKKRK